MKLAEIFAIIVVALVLVGSAHAARGANADSLNMLGRQCAGPVSGSEAEETFRAFDAEARKIKCRDLGSWSFDIDALPSHLRAIFNSTAPFTPKDLEELEIELLKHADPTAYQYVLRLMRRANELVAKGQPNRASSLLRGFAGCVKAEGLTDLIIADKGPYKSPLGTVEVPLFLGLTVKPGWPNSEVYVGNASLYAKGGPFEGYEPMLMSTKILATTGCTMASVACPILGRAMGYAAACKSTERIVRTVSAPLFARYHAHAKMGLSMEEFDKYFEEEVIKGGTIPGVPGAYSVTYRLRNKITGEVYEKSYDAGDVVQVVTVVAAAVKGVKEAAKAAEKATKTAKTRKLFGRQLKGEYSSNKIKRLKKAMQKSGFDPKKPIKIIEVDGRKIIVDGHHRARAAGSAGIKEVPVEVIEVSSEVAKQYLQQAAEAAERLGLSDRW